MRNQLVDVITQYNDGTGIKRKVHTVFAEKKSASRDEFTRHTLQERHRSIFFLLTSWILNAVTSMLMEKSSILRIYVLTAKNLKKATIN